MCFCCAARVTGRKADDSPSGPAPPHRRWWWWTIRALPAPPGLHLDAAALRVQTLYRGHRAREEVRTIAEARVQTRRVKQKEVLTRLNDYRIGPKIGRGAYGTVVKAKRGKQDEVAIKVVKRSVLKRIRLGKGTALDSALREIAIMKKLSHPNVVQLIEVIDDPELDELYLVMELVTGGTLAEPIAKGQVSTEETLVRWMRDVVLGLEHLHHSGVCHRDLKPENILWDAAGKRAKLADFGVSAICGEGRAGDYVRGTAGTPAFFAPEMCGDDKTGVRAYSGKARTCSKSYEANVCVPLLTCLL